MLCSWCRSGKCYGTVHYFSGLLANGIHCIDSSSSAPAGSCLVMQVVPMKTELRWFLHLTASATGSSLQQYWMRRCCFLLPFQRGQEVLGCISILVLGLCQWRVSPFRSSCDVLWWGGWLLVLFEKIVFIWKICILSILLYSSFVNDIVGGMCIVLCMYSGLCIWCWCI